MNTVTLLLYILVGLASLCSAQSPTIFSTQIYTGDGGAILSVAQELSVSGCRVPLLLLSDTSAGCVQKLYHSFGPLFLENYCDDNIIGATAVACSAVQCFYLVPGSMAVIVFDVLGNIYGPDQFMDYIDLSPWLSNPIYLSVYYDTDAATTSGLVVGDDGTVVQFIYDYYSVYYTTDNNPLPMTVPTTGTLAGFIQFSATGFFLAEAGDTTLTRYQLDEATAIGTAGTFGNLVRFNIEAGGNIIAYDANCGCIITLDTTLTEVRRFNSEAPLILAVTRNKALVVNANGITKYDSTAMANIVSVTPQTCALGSAGAGKIFVNVSGGDYPVAVYSWPDGVRTVLLEEGIAMLPISAAPVPAQKTVLFDDNRTWLFSAFGSPFNASNQGWVNASEIVPHSGSLSYGWRFETAGAGKVSSNTITFQCVFSNCINALQYEYLDFSINLGDGGQDFEMQLSANIYYFKPGMYPNNTWLNFTLHLPSEINRNYPPDSSFQTFFASMQFNDVSHKKVQNKIYIDSIVLRPYNVTLPDRMVYAIDACSNVMFSHNTPFINKSMTVEIKQTDVSCNVNTTTSIERAFDGKLEAIVTNGQGPYTYNWTYNNGDRNQSSMDGFGLMSSYISIYENSLNTSWVDISIASNYSFNETKYFHSAPSSIAFTPSAVGEGIIFQISPEINLSDYNTIEFWINGGPIGGQILNLYIYRSTAITLEKFTASVLQTTGVITLPPNQWVKGVFSIGVVGGPAGNLNYKYNIIEFINLADTANTWTTLPINQPTVYIDDIMLVGKNVLTVVDNQGCTVRLPKARVLSPTPIKQSISVTNAKCYNSGDGSVSISMQGGVAPYYYNWSSVGDGDDIRTGLGESFVWVNASDNNQCSFRTTQVTVLQPPQISVDLIIEHPKCFGATGKVTASAYGGASSYTYSWASNEGIPTTIAQPAPEAIFMDTLSNANLWIDGGQIICNGTGTHVGKTYSPSHSGYCSIGFTSASLAIRGCASCFSAAKYQSFIFWIYIGSNSSISNYYVNMINADHQTAVNVKLDTLATIVHGEWIKITVPMSSFPTDPQDAPPYGIVVFNSFPDQVAGVEILIDDIVVVPIVSNGAGFSDLPGFSSQIQVEAARYFLSIVDGNGCSYTNYVNVDQPAEIKMNYESTTPTVDNGSDGTITVNVTGGTPPYTYLWLDSNQATQNGVNLPAGPHTLRVSDANGCSSDLTAVVNPYNGPGVLVVRGYNATLSSGLAALVSIGLLICLFSATMLARYWGSFSTIGSFLSSMVLLGCVLSLLSALVLLPEPTDGLCTSFIWLLGVGFVLVYGCLFIKTWALYQVWRNAVHYQKANLTPMYIVRCLGAAVLLEAIFLGIWTGIDPPKARAIKIINNEVEYQCDTKHITFWIIFLVIKGIWLITGAVLAVLTKNIAKEYNDSSKIAYAIYNNVLLGAIAIPLAVLLKEVPGGRLTVEVVIISIAFIFTMVIMFFKIWHNIFVPDSKIPMNNLAMRQKRNTASSTGSIRSGDGTSKNSPTMSATASATAPSPTSTHSHNSGAAVYEV